MKELKFENFDAVIHQGNKQLIFFYQENNPLCSMRMERIKEIDQMIARDFEIYIVNIDYEPLVARAFDVVEVPEIIIMNHTKIRSRTNEALYSNQILDLISKA